MGARGARGSVRRCGQTERMLVQDTVTDERVVVLTPDKDGYTHTSRGRVAVLAARRGTVCGEVGRVPRFPSTDNPASTPFSRGILVIVGARCTELGGRPGRPG